MDFLNLEVIVGTYEQFVLGYRVTSDCKESSLDHVFAIHSHNASVRCLATAGMYAASGGADEVIQLYDMTRQKCAGALTQHEGTVTSLEFTPSGSHLLSGSEDGSIAVCRTGSWQLEKFWRQAHKGSAVISLSCHPTGKIALSLGIDGILRTWNMVKGRLAYAKNLGSAIRRLVTCVAWSVKGNWYAVVFGTKAHIYSVDTAEITFTIDICKKIASVCFVKNNVLCIGDEGGAIHIFNVVKKKKLKKLEAHSNRVKCMSSGSVNGHIYLVSAASSGQIKLWEYKKCTLSAICSVETGCRITCLVTSHCGMDNNDNVKKTTGTKLLSKPAGGDSSRTVVTVSEPSTGDSSQTVIAVSEPTTGDSSQTVMAVSEPTTGDSSQAVITVDDSSDTDSLDRVGLSAECVKGKRKRLEAKAETDRKPKKLKKHNKV